MSLFSLPLWLTAWLFVGCTPCNCDWVDELQPPSGTYSIVALGDDAVDAAYDGGTVTATAESVVIAYTDDEGYSWEVVYTVRSSF